MELQRAIDSLLKWMHRYVSPVFLALLMASFILWYIAKLSYIYTTEQKVRVDVDGQLDRAYLAGIVFADPQALADLNALVHPVVMRDFDAWAARQEGSYVILESAILFEAGLEGSVDKTVAVLAPRELRIERTCRRDGCGADQVVRRIAAQLDDDALSARADYVVVNIFEEDLEPAVVKLDRIFSHGSK